MPCLVTVLGAGLTLVLGAASCATQETTLRVGASSRDRDEDGERLELAGPAAAPARSPVAPPAPLELPGFDRLQRFSPSTIPGGLACLIRLRELEVSFVSLPALKGVLTPVRVTSPVNGIRYRALGRHPLIADCRLVLALHRAAPILLHLGVEEVLFSSAYSYRLMSSGKLSQHAMGLAIDVHRVRVRGELLEVSEDFTRGLEDGCEGSRPPLNRMACLLKSWGIFDWVLTPDFDEDHHNHFHLDIYCLHRRRHPVKEPAAEVEFD